jgi:hypothetical protein
MQLTLWQTTRRYCLKKRRCLVHALKSPLRKHFTWSACLSGLLTIVIVLMILGCIMPYSLGNNSFDSEAVLLIRLGFSEASQRNMIEQGFVAVRLSRLLSFIDWYYSRHKAIIIEFHHGFPLWVPLRKFHVSTSIRQPFYNSVTPYFLAYNSNYLAP